MRRKLLFFILLFVGSFASVISETNNFYRSSNENNGLSDVFLLKDKTPFINEGITKPRGDFDFLKNGEYMTPFGDNNDIKLFGPPPGYDGDGLGLLPITESLGVYSFLLIMIMLYLAVKAFYSNLRKKINKKCFLLLLLFFPFMGFAAGPLTVSLTPTNGVCKADCKITVSASGGTPGSPIAYLYALTGPSSRPAQSSAVFDNLVPGSYAVLVYDDGAYRTSPYTTTTSVSTPYQTLELYSATPSVVGSCAPNGVITITPKGGKAPLRYRIDSGPVGYTLPPDQSSNVFSNLPAGDYVVSVWDDCNNGSNSSPIAVTNVTNNQVIGKLGLSANPFTSCTDIRKIVNFIGNIPNTDYNKAIYDVNGILIPAQFLEYRIEYPKSSGIYTTWANVYGGNSFWEGELKLSNYTPGTPFTIVVHHKCTDQYFAKDTLYNIPVMQSFSFSNSLSGVCSGIGTEFTLTNLQPVTDVGITTFATALRLEYPVGSNNWADITQIGSSGTYRCTIPGTYTSGDPIKVEIRNTCTNQALFKIVNPNLVYDFNATLTQSGSIYCSIISTLTVNNLSSFICNPLHIKVYKKTTPGTLVLDVTTTNDNTAKSFAFSNLQLDPNTTYTVYVEDSSNPAHNKTIDIITPSASFPNMALNSQYGQSDNACSSTMNIITSLAQQANSSITYTLLNPPSGFSGNVVVTKDGGTVASTILWSGLPFGSYNVKIDYGCRNIQATVSLAPPTADYHHSIVGNIYVTPTTGSCVGTVTLKVALNKNGRESWASTYDDFRNLPYMAYNTDYLLNYVCELWNEAGTVKLATATASPGQNQFFTFLGVVSGNYIIKTYSKASFITDCPYNDVRNYTISRASAGLIDFDISASGGITCSGVDNGILYMAATSSTPIQYRMKVQGADDSAYTPWQLSNQFPNTHIGDYTVQLKNDCQTLTQNFSMLDGSQSFLRLSFPVNAEGKVCSQNRVVMKVLPMGPVSNFRWYKDGVLIPGETKDSLVINNATVDDSGNYIVKIKNIENCDLEDSKPLIVQPTPDFPTLNFSMSADYCGSLTSLGSVTATITFNNGGTLPYSFDVAGTTYQITSGNSQTISLTPHYGANRIELSNVKNNTELGCTAIGTAENNFRIYPPTATWINDGTASTGAASAWSDDKNWDTAIPGPCTYVTIPEGAATYPILTDTENATCDVIDFKFGGEVAKTSLLTYNQAKVALTLAKNRWNTISAPLRDMYSGDYFSDLSFLPSNPLKRQNPTVYMMYYQMNNPQTGLATGNGAWSNPFNTLDEQLNVGLGYTIWIDEGNRSESNFDFDFPRDSVYYNMYLKNGTFARRSGTMSRINKSRFAYETGDYPSSTAGTGAFSVAIPGDKTGYDKVIIGNPFMSHLDFAAFQSGNSGKITNSYQVFGGTSFETVLASGAVTLSTTSDVRYIAPMQSFIVTKTTPSSILSSFDFNTDMSVTRPGLKLRSEETTSNVLTLEVLRNNIRQSGMVLHYLPGESNTFRNDKDAFTFFNESDFDSGLTEGPAVIYTLLDQRPASIHTVGNITAPFELGIRTVEKSRLTLKASGTESFDGNYQLILTDRLTNKKINLSKTPEYQFENQTGNVTGRFCINILQTSGEITDIETVTDSDILIYSDKNTVNISSNPNDLIRSVEVIGLQGQCLIKKIDLNVSHVSYPLPYGQTVLIVKVKTGNNQRIEKIMVK